MSGHVFHPGHEALHGVTVVVEGTGGVTWVGRYHERNDRGVLMHDVAVYHAGVTPLALGAWIEQLRKFGIRVEQRAVVVPSGEAARITSLGEWAEPKA